MHTKGAVFDGVVSTLGSFNLDPRSRNLNSEDTLCIHDLKFGIQMNNMFANDLKDSTEITQATLQNDTLNDLVEQWFYGEVVKPEL